MHLISRYIHHHPSIVHKATGKPRNFVFTRRGYAMARYRFVPVTDGVVHGTLDKLTSPQPDAGPVPAAQP